MRAAVGRALAGGVIALAVSGCSSTVKRTLPDSVRTIAIERFRNDTAQDLLPALLHEEIRRAFRLDGRLAVLDDPIDAHSVLKGAIIDYVKQPARFDRNNVVQEYRLRMAVDLSLVDVTQNRVLWTESGPASTAYTGGALRKLERFVNFVVVPAEGLPVETEPDAQRRMVRDLARDIVVKVVEGW
jgi:hypothetical protein